MSTQTLTVLLLGTCDTKLAELLYIKEQIETQSQINVLIMDIGRNTTNHPDISFTPEHLLQQATEPIQSTANNNDTNNIPDLKSLPRATYISTLATSATQKATHLYQTSQIHGILAIGGSCGTTLATAVMRDALPVGFPKLMVSTMASGDVAPYIGETDISMMYSVVDIAGRNRVLERVLGNAGGAVAGMALSYYRYCHANLSKEVSMGDALRDMQDIHSGKNDNANGGIRIAISMFGVTTPSVTHARQHLESVLPNCEVYIFHATGSGGRAMERLIREGQLDAVLDLTTTEIADEVVGGVLSAGPGRLSAATARGIPRVVSVGACDMVNFGERKSVPSIFWESGSAGDSASESSRKQRLFHEHNAAVTLMRTTAEECVLIARMIARNLLGGSEKTVTSAAQPGTASETSGLARTKVVLPTGGVSMLDVPSQPFWDPEADEVLFSTLENELQGSGIEVVRDTHAINEPGFAVAVADELVHLIQVSDNK
ncbi:hypothetical protein NUU61_007775 [Penicillium alfredii]|uniref:Uncharacterized protein n=1 Tax=Penicillium alfredii TaxID=1506179 RepID=A0A9W9ER41_9EURO|nr:uncharacterized protein NUU61_007775 [Penicillium alfredii]KAJ5086468.1 hypothetical protein NUU61_007775 [Penicillium alfredii]